VEHVGQQLNRRLLPSRSCLTAQGVALNEHTCTLPKVPSPSFSANLILVPRARGRGHAKSEMRLTKFRRRGFVIEFGWELRKESVSNLEPAHS
jgi:hypothetical protein